jgi:hypothetical protein
MLAEISGNLARLASAFAKQRFLGALELCRSPVTFAAIKQNGRHTANAARYHNRTQAGTRTREPAANTNRSPERRAAWRET